MGKGSFQRFLASEHAAALEHLKNLESLNIYQDSIVIFDRGYYSENFFRYCVEHGHLCLAIASLSIFLLIGVFLSSVFWQ